MKKILFILLLLAGCQTTQPNGVKATQEDPCGDAGVDAQGASHECLRRRVPIYTTIPR